MTVVVANPTVTVSFSTSVETAVTVIKMLVVPPLMLVLVCVPWPWLCARSPLPLLRVVAVVVVEVGAGASWDVIVAIMSKEVEEVEVAWMLLLSFPLLWFCVTGMTAKGTAAAEEASSEMDEEVVVAGWTCSV